MLSVFTVIYDANVLYPAALRASADVIVTYNLKDFPDEILRPYGIEAQHPDEFISHLLDLDPQHVLASVRSQLAKLQNPPVSAQQFLMHLERLQLPISVAALQPYFD